MQPSKRRRLTATSIALVSLLLLGVSPTATSAASSLSFRAYIGNRCVEIEGAAANAALTLVWRDSAGNLKERATLTASDFSFAQHCSSESRVAAGDSLKVTSSSDTHRLVVPALSISVNRVTNRVKGTGPAGATLKIECNGADPFRHFEPCIWTRRVTVGSDGRWSTNIPFDVIGGGEMIVRWRAGNDVIRAWATAPFINVTLGRPGFDGAADSGAMEHVELSGKATGSANADPFNGVFKGHFRDDADQLVAAAPGDLLIADIAADSAWIIPEINGTASAATDVVSGRCHDAGASRNLVNVLLYRSGRERGWALLDTEADGSFSFNFRTDDADPFWSNQDVLSGDKIVIRCMQAEGDWAQLLVFAS